MPDIRAIVDSAGSLRAGWRRYKETVEPCAWSTFQARYHREAAERIEPQPPVPHIPRVEKIGVAFFDMHIPHHDQSAIDCAIEFVRSEVGTPDIFLNVGDYLDCESVSRWAHDPYGIMPIHEEFEYGAEYLAGLVKRMGAARNVYIKGNHEDRLQRYLWERAPKICRLRGLTIQEQLGLESLGVEWVDNLDRKANGQPFFHIGKLYFLHGHELGICPRVNPARQYMLRALDNLICGHVHKLDRYPLRTIGGKTIAAWVCGPLCDLNPAYRPQNDWQQGFAIIRWYSDGYFHVELRQVIEGRVL